MKGGQRMFLNIFIKKKSHLFILIIILLVSCNGEKLGSDTLKLESDAIGYFNDKYPGSVSKRKVGDDSLVRVDFTVEKNVDESDLVYLNNIRNINVFRMSRGLITEKVVESLKSQKKLEILSLEDTNLTDKGLQEICLNHPNLERLFLNNTPVTSEGLKYIGRLQKLQVLELRATKIDDDGIKYLSEMNNIGTLELSNTDITDKSIPYLMNFKKLGLMYIVHTKITKEGAQVLIDHYKKLTSREIVSWDPETSW